MKAIRSSLVVAAAAVAFLAMTAGPSQAFKPRNETRMIPAANTAARTHYDAAMKGDAEAQASLGALYAKGSGVPQSDTHALQWLMRAAEQGHAGAQQLLGEIFANGKGVRRDDVLAYKWTALAAAHADDAEVRENAAKVMTTLRQRMSEAQLAEARNLATGWSAEPEAPQGMRLQSAVTRPAPAASAPTPAAAPPASVPVVTAGDDAPVPGRADPAKVRSEPQVAAPAAPKETSRRARSSRGAQAYRRHGIDVVDPLTFVTREARFVPARVRSLIRLAYRLGF